MDRQGGVLLSKKFTCPFVETPSSYQTQAGDLSREERVEDEDDWLWT